jgi:hypothetical protein
MISLGDILAPNIYGFPRMLLYPFQWTQTLKKKKNSFYRRVKFGLFDYKAFCMLIVQLIEAFQFTSSVHEFSSFGMFGFKLIVHCFVSIVLMEDLQNLQNLLPFDILMSVHSKIG